MLGDEAHWTESGTHTGVFASRQLTHTSIRERQDRVRLLNKILSHYSLTIDDWAATAYMLRTQTGRSQIVQNLSQLWQAVETLTGQSCDVLDNDLLTKLNS